MVTDTCELTERCDLTLVDDDWWGDRCRRADVVDFPGEEGANSSTLYGRTGLTWLEVAAACSSSTR